MVEQPALARHAARVAGERAVCPDDPVTRNHQRHRVATVRRANGPGRARPADRLRKLAVAARLPRRNAAQRLPDLLLKQRQQKAQSQSQSNRALPS